MGKKRVFSKKTQAESGHKSKIMIGAMIFSILFLMNFAVAEELTTFDNVKDYDPVLQKVTIENTFGIGRTIADVTLDTPLNMKVARGYQKVAQFTINTYDAEYTNPLEKIDFYNYLEYSKLEDKAVTLDRQFDYKLLTYENVVVDDYVTECSDFIDAKNGSKTNLCYETIRGNHTEIKEKWIDFDYNTLKAGKYTVGIFTDVKKGDYVEFIPNYFGVKLSEFASWSESMNTSLLHYYKFQEASGNVDDAIDIAENDLVANGTTSNATGIKLNCRDFEWSVADSFQSTNNFEKTGDFDWSYSVWFWIEDYVAGDGSNVFDIGTAGGGVRYHLWLNYSGGLVADVSGTQSISINATTTKKVWHHVVFNYTASTDLGCAILDGTKVKCDTGAMNLGAGKIWVGKAINTIINNWDGLIDEFVIWNRTLTNSEMTDLWNSGFGLGLGEINNYNPLVNINSPENYSNFSTSTILFNVTVYVINQGAYTDSVALYIDSVNVETNTTNMANGTTYTFTRSISSGFHNWSITATTSNSTTNSTALRVFNITINSPDITVHFPYSNSNYSTNAIHFNSTITDDFAVKNVSMYIDTVLNNTNTSGVNGSYSWDFYLSEGSHTWSITAYDNDSNPTSSATIPFTIDLSNPILSTSGITDQYNSTLPINLTWSLFNADLQPDKCWYYTSDNSTNISVTCNGSTTTNFYTRGSKTIYYFGNDSTGHQSTGNATLFVGYYPYTQSTNKANVGLGDSVIFTLYVNGTDVNTLWPSTTATINFNGTVYTPDTTDRSNQNYTKYTKTLYMAIGNTTGANTPYNWSYSIKNTTAIPLNVTTTTATIKVYLMSVYECSAGSRYILNASIKDEELNTLIDASLNTTTIEIDLTVSSRANTSATWNFSKKWINNNTVYICVSPNVLTYSSYRIDFTVGYKADGYVQEFYYMDNGTIDSSNNFNSYTSIPISLYDLESADSTTFLFKFKDEDNLEVDDAIIHVFRKYIGDGIFREVERAEQDNNGETHVHLVEEDVIYYFMITQYGHIIYTSVNYNAKCLSTPCQIELSASPDFTEFPTDYDEVNGTVFTLTSSKNTRTVTLNYVSNSSKVVNLSVFKVIDGQTISYIDTTALTGTSGTLTLNIPLSSGNETFFASIFSDGTFVRSEWVDMRENAQDYFGTTGAILGGLLVLTLIFMAISEGVVLIIIGIVAILIVGAMQLVDLSWLAIISIICAGLLIVWKLTQGGNKR